MKIDTTVCRARAKRQMGRSKSTSGMNGEYSVEKEHILIQSYVFPVYCMSESDGYSTTLRLLKRVAAATTLENVSTCSFLKCFEMCLIGF